MTLVEIVLLVIILILFFISINQNLLFIKTKSKLRQNKTHVDRLFQLLKKVYSLFQKARRFSIVYILRNRFYKFYLIIAVSVVATKIFLHYNPQAIPKMPILSNKIIDFLIVSSAWEIICVFTKIIDQNISKK